ncbi:membrane-bound alkaline phosphatase-like [Musca vetustissima]|uniref:membrane-bound alkaline phosphatase-like n=1 Tax=Musca vetustissima TaxID=27455 RepID=UPI002AB6C389|nr:membrane-bound alkaline phosphatase-like [Musca vetustissima]
MDDEECRDRLMHPDLPVDPNHKSRALDGEKESDYWLNQGKQFVETKIKTPLNTKKAKNVIMFLGDGMGLTTTAAARNLIGGEHAELSFEKFPHVGLAKTYAVDKIVPDSANTATAYLCGVKAMYGTLGVNGRVEREDCQTMLDKSTHVTSIAQWAIDAGKSAGVVTTTRVTHASPAGAYAHIAERDWENDFEVKQSCGRTSNIDDIALQLIHGETGSKFKIMMGGGKHHFVDSSLYSKGKRSDGRNLIEEYKAQNPRNAYVETKEELAKLNLKEVDRILGLFHDSHLEFRLDTDENATQPTLEEMTRRTIEFLSQDENGYFVFIEGGRIDSAHHDNTPRKALDETIEFSKAIQLAREMTNEEDTLIVVTADHSHAFTYGGYPYRGSDIFASSPTKPDDKTPMMVLGYSNGPGHTKFYDSKNGVRHDPTTLMTGKANDEYPATFPRDSETHGGEDVAVYASGPWSHLFTGVYEQNAIPHMMAYALCVGNGLKACD